MAESSAYSKERGLEERKEPHLVLFDKSSWKKPERCMELGAGWLPQLVGWIAKSLFSGPQSSWFGFTR